MPWQRGGAGLRVAAFLLESLRREVEDAERGSGHRDRQLQHSSERAAATVSLRSMDASGGAGHEDHVIPSRAKLEEVAISSWVYATKTVSHVTKQCTASPDARQFRKLNSLTNARSQKKGATAEQLR